MESRCDTCEQSRDSWTPPYHHQETGGGNHEEAGSEDLPSCRPLRRRRTSLGARATCAVLRRSQWVSTLGEVCRLERWRGPIISAIVKLDAGWSRIRAVPHVDGVTGKPGSVTFLHHKPRASCRGSSQRKRRIVGYGTIGIMYSTAQQLCDCDSTTVTQLLVICLLIGRKGRRHRYKVKSQRSPTSANVKSLKVADVGTLVTVKSQGRRCQRYWSKKEGITRVIMCKNPENSLPKISSTPTAHSLQHPAQIFGFIDKLVGCSPWPGASARRSRDGSLKRKWVVGGGTRDHTPEFVE